MFPMRGADKHEYAGRYSGIRMIVTVSRVRSTEKTYMFCAAETMYVKKAIEETE